VAYPVHSRALNTPPSPHSPRKSRPGRPERAGAAAAGTGAVSGTPGTVLPAPEAMRMSCTQPSAAFRPATITDLLETGRTLPAAALAVNCQHLAAACLRAGKPRPRTAGSGVRDPRGARGSRGARGQGQRREGWPGLRLEQLSRALRGASGRLMNSVCAVLGDGPGVVVLNNFETPWTAEPVSVEALLRRVAAIPGMGWRSARAGQRGWPGCGGVISRC
jgi:hypothetical protein